MANDPKISTKVEVSKDYAAVLEKVAALRARQQAARTEIGQIRTRLMAGQGNDGRDARAAAILSGETADEKANDLARLTVLAREVADIERALELLSENASRESGKASQLVCDVAEPHYKKAVADICKNLIALHESHSEFESIVRSLNDDSVAWTGRMHPMQPNFLGAPQDKYNFTGCYLREAAKHDFISASQIPIDLRV